MYLVDVIENVAFLATLYNNRIAIVQLIPRLIILSAQKVIPNTGMQFSFTSCKQNVTKLESYSQFMLTSTLTILHQ